MSTATATPTFTGRQLAEAAGCTYRQVDYWGRTGLLTPSVVPADGSGSRRGYSVVDVELGRMIAALARFGSLATARAAADDLRAVLEAPVRPVGVYVTDTGTVCTDPTSVAAVWLPLGGVS